MNSQFAPMPKRVDWPLLITLLRNTYTHGDGGLSAESGIDAHLLSYSAKKGVHSWSNGVTLWNLAVNRLSGDELQRCISRKFELARE